MITGKMVGEWREVQEEIGGKVYTFKVADFDVTAFGEIRRLVCRQGRDDAEADLPYGVIGGKVGRTGAKVWAAHTRLYRQGTAASAERVNFWDGSASGGLNLRGFRAVGWMDKVPESVKCRR